MIEKLLIANRGEIACRIIRTCRRLGVRTVAVYSDADARSQHVLAADEAWHLGGPRPVDSYLRGERILEVAQASGAQAIHPGFGFLSENADFADAVVAAGLIFVGPYGRSMRAMGSKSAAKALMQAAGVPTVPGDLGDDQDPEALAAAAARVGFPLMIKASGGGGGKGMRIVRGPEEFAAALASAKREAANAFKTDHVLLERYVETPRHIEFQVFGDTQGQVIHLNERECSVQRRYQKIIEETPSPFLTPERRAAMGAAAVAAAKAVDYVGAGTVEFIVGAGGDFYFMEMNTRLQVEHPVTELTLGIDLVEWQLKIAAGEPLPWRQEDVRAHGHAIEVRLYAEDPENGFLPGSGRLEVLTLPAPGPRVRIDSGVAQGDEVTIHYDPMIAKLIVHDRTRPLAIERLKEALAETTVVGPKSNVEFLETLARHPRFVAGAIDTGYLDRALQEVLVPKGAAPEAAIAAAATLALLSEEFVTRTAQAATADPHSPWARADGWRPGHWGKRMSWFEVGGERLQIGAHGHDGDYELDWANQHLSVRQARLGEGRLNFLLGERAVSCRVTQRPDGIHVHDGERRWRLVRINPYASGADRVSTQDRVRAPMPGRIVAVRVALDEMVNEGQEVLVMEAMKMELSLKAPQSGRVAELRVAVGDFVEADAVLLRVEAG
ncbi:MAG: ATP-grasp domain-containing protein [Xanthomonadales bacterium]|jgi:3-methylcrotonyl-CoA carboxylase alpha subunit|nr:ATP-grasp domain-containing protein [Xanthomonadales bacterium]